MPDKLTDSEIVKALECCSEANNCGKCEYEPTEHQMGTVGCCNELMKDALSIINRLQEENEELKTENRILSQKRFNIFERIEYTEKLNNAYKEFAEKLKAKMDLYIFGTHCKTFTHNDIDNLLKELGGENK